VRKWLLYLTLFVAALIIIIDTVMLVQGLLNGELTVRFLMKLLTVFVTAGAIFGYYFYDLKKYKIQG
jgi:hypothetical protein